MPVNISITKRRACGSEPFFNFDSSVVQSFIRVNDSVYTLIFKAVWKGKIYGSIAGCRLLTDSVTLTVLDAPPVLNLGGDTLLCNGGSIVLHAGKGYKSYLWQDGTTDSTLTVIKPGTYYVVAENTCLGIFKDTIVVTGHPVISFNLGPDTALCPGNTIVLHAPVGYHDYLWQNGDVDSVFIVRAPGIYHVTVQNVCTAPFTDTISVFNHPLIPFDMGPDLSV